RRAALCPDPSRLSSWSVGPAAETPSSTGWRVSRGPGGGYRMCTTVGFSPADYDTRDDSMRLTAGLVTGHRGGLPEKMKMSGADHSHRRQLKDALPQHRALNAAEGSRNRSG